MTLQRDASGSQTFVNPAQYSTQDLRPGSAATPVQPYLGAAYAKPVAIRGMPGLFYGSVTLFDASGPFQQEGKLPYGGSARAAGSLKGDRPGIVRLPIVTTPTATADWTDTPYRMTHTHLFDALIVAVMSSGTTSELMVEDPTTTLMSLMTGFTAASIGNHITCIGKLEGNGTTYLLVGYENQKGGGQTLQTFDTLNNATWVPSFIPSGNAPIWGFVQLPDSTLMVYETNHITMVDVKNVAPAATVFTDKRATVTEGGYMVGTQALGGAPLACYIVVPKDGWILPGFLVSELKFGPNTSYQMRGKLQRVDLRGWTVEDVITDLPWVTFSTKLRDGLMNCDTHTHVYLNGRQRAKMKWLQDRALPSNQTIVCRGHYTDGVRFWWLANRLTTGAATVQWWEEVQLNEADLESSISLPCSLPVVLEGADVQSVGGWHLPWSERTKMLRDYAGGKHYTQYQPDPDELGYDLRKTASTGFVVGQAFEASDSWTLPILQYPGAEGCPIITARIEAPQNRHIATGQDPAGGYTTPAYVKLRELLSGVGETFHARGEDERRPVRDFPLNRSWSYGLQPYMELGRQTGGSDESRYTPNGVPATYHVLFYKDGLGGGLPRQYRDLDATKVLKTVV